MAKKTFTTSEIISICSWYYNVRAGEKRGLFDHFPIKFQWNLKKNMDKLFKINDSFNEFRNDIVNTFNSKYFDNPDNLNEDKSLKDDIKAEYDKELNEINNKLISIVNEVNTVDIITMNLDSIIERLEDNEKFTMDDIYMITFMDENKEDNIDSEKDETTNEVTSETVEETVTE